MRRNEETEIQMQNPRNNLNGTKNNFEENNARAVLLLANRALHDEDPLTRKHAIYMLSMAWNPEDIQTFVQALKDPVKEVRSQATRALAIIGEPAGERLIFLLNDPDWKVRYRAAEALGMIGDEKAACQLIGLLSDNEDHVRYMAAKSLGTLRNPAAREVLQRCQKDENAFVRAMASYALSKIRK